MNVAGILLIAAATTLTCAKVYFDVRRVRPHWEGRAEVVAMVAGIVVPAVTGIAVGSVTDHEYQMTAPPRIGAPTVSPWA